MGLSLALKLMMGKNLSSEPAQGRAYRQRVYAPDRLKYPLRRVGTRGEGKFERISWDEALETVARELIRVRDTYGPAAIFLRYSAGDIICLHNACLSSRSYV